MKGKLMVASLFSGCGGMDIGMKGSFTYLGREYKEHPVELVYAIDNNRGACEIYNENFDLKCLEEDINNINSLEIPPHHILTGGFPCQSFSIVAQNPPRLGYKDEKGRLFFEMCRILRTRKPFAFIAENVKGILSANKGRAFPLILKNFQQVGYHVTHAVLNAADYGVPQKRERVFIVGFRDRRMLNIFKFPPPTTKTKKVPLKKVLESDDVVDEKYYFSKRALKGLIKANGKRTDMNKGRVQDINQPCNTVGAHLAKVSLNSTDPVLKIGGRYRMFTPREVARIQSFPESFRLPGTKTQLYKVLGNAVPPVLMWHITREVIKVMEKADRKILSRKPYRTRKEIRSFNMSRIRGIDTTIEVSLRRALRNKGMKFIANDRKIIGKPDIVFKNEKIAIFCDSSFWHGRNYHVDTGRIKTNQKYWREKIKRNRERDREVTKGLKDLGWKVLRFWDEDIKGNLDSVVEEIVSSIGENI